MPCSENEVQKLLDAGKTPRARRIEESQRYHDGSIYDGRPGFFEDIDTPLRERAPCVVYPVVRNAVQSFTAMCLGDGKFPTITTGTSEDDSAFDTRFGLSPDDSKTIDAGIRQIVRQTRLRAVAQQALEAGLISGTCVTVVSVTRGKLRVSQIDAKCCAPTFDEGDPELLKSVEVSYRYVTDDTLDPGTGKYAKRVFQYRRVIDATYDTVFVPVEVTQVNQRPVPSTPKTKYRHGFGFCPVVWYRMAAPVSDIADIDGRPIHWGLFSLVDSVNFALSQRFRAALYAGDPQICEFGVADDEFDAPMGRAADIRQPGVDRSGYNEPLFSRRGAGFSKRKKGAGTVWRYTNADAKVQVLTLPGDALSCLADDAKDNIKKLREALGHVYIDPEELTGSGDISGKTLSFLYSQQIAKCDKYREDFGEKWLLPVVNMLFRVVLASGKGLYLAGAAPMQKILVRFQQKVDGATDVMWFEPSLKLAWGDYFPTSDMDESTRIKTVIQALTCPRPLITLATAVLAIKSIFPDIQDPEQYVLGLAKEADDRRLFLAKGGSQTSNVSGDDGSAAKPADTPQDDKRATPPANKPTGRGPGQPRPNGTPKGQAAA